MITIGYSTREIDDNFIELLKKSVGLPGVNIIPVKNNGEYSLSEVYNRILNESQTDIVILLHDDIYFDTKNWGQKIMNHFKRNNDYGILGLAGSTSLPTSAKWWEDTSKMKGIVNHEHNGKKWESKYSQNKGNQIDDVVLVDGLFIVVNKNKIKTNFNNNIEGFHFYDVDFCVNNFTNDVKIGVVYDIRVTHKSIGQTNEQWENNRVKFANLNREILPLKIKRNLNIDSPLKILISCLFFKTYTGSEMYVYELAKNLKKLNCDVTILSDINGPLSNIAKKQGIKVLPFNQPPGYKVGDGRWGFNTPEGFQPSQPNLMYKVSDVDYDIIHTQHTPITKQICQLYPNINKISTIHSEVIDLEIPVLDNTIKKYICIRPEIQNHIINKFEINEEETTIIYNPIDNNRFNKQNIKDKGYILFVGTIDYLRESTIRDLIEYSETQNKELWLVGDNKSTYLNEILLKPNVKYFNSTPKIEEFVKNCSLTAGVLLGRTTIEGWMCDKPGWIYDINKEGEIISKELHYPPTDTQKFYSFEVAKKIKEEYIKILNK